MTGPGLAMFVDLLAAKMDLEFGVVPKLWPGSTIVIIGGGSSLTREDVTYVSVRAAARRLERRLLQTDAPEIRIIAIKEAVELCPEADVLYGCDFKFWKANNGVPGFTGLKFALEQSPDQPPVDWSPWPDVHVLRNTGMEGLELNPTGVRTGQNSGYQAVNVAVHLGAAKIVLIGFDMWRGSDGRQNWFEGSPQALKYYHEPSPYGMFLSFFATMVEPLNAAGVQVVNASRFTVMRSFPCVSLVEALS